ncbi:hypothetical protein BGZ65_011509 [Modicella reniformis]|uniref:B30.2/SPRY domain-containing protein n=1 Tax=Modicella reniformis TaxID=1440133 RepID=A0A9P6LTR3_9FUNG|nr:hypothetical protein BGZ65_011509 [Modicella reniformis]
MQEHSLYGVPPSLQTPWSHSSTSASSSSLSQSTGMPPFPTPVELQSSLTDITPIGSKKLDPAAGINARVSRPFISSQPIHSYPSAIEVQSSLTEIDTTLGRLSGSSSNPASASYSGAGSGSGSGSNFRGQLSHAHPSSFQNHGHRPNDHGGHPSAIEQQSSLTEIDNLPFPLEAQSSLTVIDNLPYTLEEQSALTELDSLPHLLKDQSSLTVVDDLTEIDNLPHAISEQSSLTVIDEPKTLSSIKDTVTAKDSIKVKDITTAKDKAPSVPPKLTTITTTTIADATPLAKRMSEPRSPPAPETPFSMSNWTMPSDFSDVKPSDDFIKKRLSSTGSLHRRAPATMHIDTSAKENDPATDNGGILIPLTPTTPTNISGVDLPQGKPLSSSSSVSRKAKSPVGSRPPIPPPRPTSLMAVKINHPHSGSSGAEFTMSEKIQLEEDILPPETIATDGGVLVPALEIIQQIDEQLVGEDVDEDDEDEDEDLVNKVDDGMSAFIRELQSSMSLSRSGSGSGNNSSNQKSFSDVKRADSSSSKTSQRVSENSYGDSQAKGVDWEPPQSSVNAVDLQESLQSVELQQLETTQFEWTFSKTEQAAYERIFSLWERPAELCVSSDIAGKVFMTLGLTNHDLFNIWQLLNPEEKTVLTRIQFIAGLHLVNCKLVGYELPDELPDELMMSAAAVGRAVIPPRPVQGPSTILANYVEPVATEPQNPQAQLPVKNSSPEVDPMSMYNISLPSYSTIVPPIVHPDTDAGLENSDIYLAYPQQHYQQQHQYNQFAEDNYYGDGSFPTFSPGPISTPLSKPVPMPVPMPDTPTRPSKPGPHALHDLPADAPVFVSLTNDDSLLGGRESPIFNESSTLGATSHSGMSFTDSPTPPTNQVADSSVVDTPDLYTSAPDAWDHDTAPPELDVEGNYIKYRSDFKNERTLSASVTANHPINPKSGVFYFEITIDQFKGGAISIGIASKSLRKNCQVGWDLNSWGYHSEDGCLYFGNGNQSIQYSYKYNEEDVVGCGINFIDRAVFFTLNGDMLGVAFRFLKDTIPLYPAIGLSHAGTEINANFGDQTFLFNIVDYKKRVMSKPVPIQPLSTWNNGARNQKVFRILGDGLSVIATGTDVGCIRGTKVSPRDRDVFYFEVTILYTPTDQGTIMVGICGKEQSMTETLGWKPNSYGYSGECGDFLSISSNRSSLNARSQSGKMKARARGPPFRAGSVVGCGVDFASRELFFTLNGECLGQAFCEVDVLDCHACVCVIDGGDGEHLDSGGPLSGARPSYASQGLTHSGGGSADERIRFEFKANFGQYPFTFDLPAFEIDMTKKKKVDD